MKNKLLLSIIFFVALQPFLFAEIVNYENEKKAIQEVLKSFTLREVHSCSKEEVDVLLRAAIEQNMNLFELLYAVNEYLTKTGNRISIKGDILRELESKITYGNERVYALIPISIIEEIEVGAIQKDKLERHIIDIFFKEPYEKYIEIGTAIYKKHIGFNKTENNCFYGCFGMNVKKIGIKKKIDKIEMYEKTKIAIYVKGFPRPKRWIFETMYLK
ncbi:MAG: hypothetical protein ACTTKH_01530 [Treponema sp.]